MDSSMTRWTRTKIVCTLGPATDAPGIIERLIDSGMDVARINASHGDHVEHARRIQQVRHAAQQCDQPVAILIDLPGPKFRLGDLSDGCCKLVEGSISACSPRRAIRRTRTVIREKEAAFCPCATLSYWWRFARRSGCFLPTARSSSG